MSFGEKTGRSAFFALKGSEVVRLNDAPAYQNDLTCIGKSVPIRSGGVFLCDVDLFVTHTGAVCVRVHGPVDSISQYARPASIVAQCSEVLRTWSHKQLDDVSSLYSYEVDGQSALVIDVLVRGGRVTYSDKTRLNAAFDKTLASGSFLIEVSDTASPGHTIQTFIEDFCYFRGLDSDEMTEAVLELETCNGVAAVLRGSKLGILYTPPGGAPPITLFYFQVSGTRADLCVSPDRTHHDLERAGFSPLSANGLLEFFLKFIDKKLTKVPAGGGVVETLYLLPEPLFENIKDLKEHIVQFAGSL